MNVSEPNLKPVSDFIVKATQDSAMPGAVSFVSQRGEVLHKHTFGFSDIESQTRINFDTLFRIYSMTKPITSVAVLQLIEQGRLNLSTPLADLIPAFREVRVYKSGSGGQTITEPPKRDITIKDLLCHTAGFSNPLFSTHPVDELYKQADLEHEMRTGNLESFVNKLTTLPLAFSPGDHWRYSLATDVLGYVVEVVTGRKFNDYLQTEIFDPLDMHDTGFVVPADKQHRVASLYTQRRFLGDSETNSLTKHTGRNKSDIPIDEKLVKLKTNPLRNDIIEPATFFSGAGGLYSSAEDYIKFVHMLAGSHKVHLLQPKSLKAIHTNTLHGDIADNSLPDLKDAFSPGIGFGLGLGCILDPAKTGMLTSKNMYFWGGVGNTYFFIDPKHDLIGLFMTQMFPSTLQSFSEEFVTCVYESLGYK